MMTSATRRVTGARRGTSCNRTRHPPPEMTEQTLSTTTEPARWPTARIARLALTAILAVYGIALLRTPGFALLDNVNLPIHETGHLVFAAFGDFITALGGTLFQLIVPAVFMGYFLRRRDPHSASVALWWVGQNLWNISIYIADAQEQDLPLVGGGEHDCAFLLAEMDLLQRDDEVAAMVRFVGTMIYVLAIAWGAMTIARPQPTTAER